MIASKTDEKLMLEYVKRILHADNEYAIFEIDNEVTFDDGVSTTGYAILMNVIDMRKETLK